MKLGQWFSKFMTGRYGNDRYGLFLSIAALFPLVASMFFRGAAGIILRLIAIALIVYLYFRVLSRNIPKRQAENRAYLKIRDRVVSSVRGARSRFSQRKQYRFFRCGKCRSYLRVPRGKGKLRVHCPHCGFEFEAKA